MKHSETSSNYMIVTFVNISYKMKQNGILWNELKTYDGADLRHHDPLGKPIPTIGSNPVSVRPRIQRHDPLGKPIPTIGSNPASVRLCFIAEGRRTRFS